MEGKEILKALNLPEELDSVEKIVAAHSGRYVGIDEAHDHEKVKATLTGRILGGLEAEVKRTFKLTPEDVKEKDIKTILKEVAGKYDSKITELEGAANNDEKYNTLKKEYDGKMVLFEQTKNDLQRVAGDLETEKKSANEKIKGFKVKSIYGSIKDKLPFIDGVKEVEKVGFDALFGSKYTVDIDEKDNVLVLDKDGKKIPSKEKAGEYLNLAQVMDFELEAQGLKKKNNLTGPVRLPNTGNLNQNQRQDSNGRGEKRVHPRAAEAAAHYSATK